MPAERRPRGTTMCLIIGAVVTTTAAVMAYRHESTSDREVFRRAATTRLQSVRHQLDRGRLAIQLMNAFYRASDNVDPDEFHRFAEQVLADESAVIWVGYREHAEGAAGGGAELLIAPPQRVDEARRCLSTELPGEGLSADMQVRNGRPLLILQHTTAVAERSSSNQRGAIVVAIDLQQVLELGRQYSETAGIDLSIQHATDPDRPAAYLPSRLVESAPKVPPSLPESTTHGLVTVADVAGLELALVATRSAAASDLPGTLTWVLTGLGVLATTIAAFAAGSAARTRARIEHVVALRTSELADANRLLEQRVADRTRELANANRELEAFNFSVSHDLRAPLRAIDGFAGILLEDHGDVLPAEGHRVLGIIRSSSAEMSHLIDSLLRLSRLGRQALALTEVDVDATVHEVIEELRAHGDATKHEFAVGRLGRAVADRVLLREVFRNLLGNAVKYSAKVAAPRVEVRRQDHDESVEFVVGDNGAGFDPDFADKLFAPFQRLHRSDEFEGSGIGLALCQRIVHRFGGRIEGTGTPGAGATFRFHLPTTVSRA